MRAPNTNVNQAWLNVFDLDASSTAVAMASKINVIAGPATGTLLADADRNQAVLFNTGSAGSTIAGTISYSVPAASTAHYITEVPANTGYAVTVSVNAGMHSISITPGGRFYSSAKGVLSFTVSAAGAVSAGDRIFANGFD
ncbi:MAG: hypothetical protein ACYC7G_06675 [Rudaea sp.]